MISSWISLNCKRVRTRVQTRSIDLERRIELKPYLRQVQHHRQLVHPNRHRCWCSWSGPWCRRPPAPWRTALASMARSRRSRSSGWSAAFRRWSRCHRRTGSTTSRHKLVLLLKSSWVGDGRLWKPCGDRWGTRGARMRWKLVRANSGNSELAETQIKTKINWPSRTVVDHSTCSSPSWSIRAKVNNRELTAFLQVYVAFGLSSNWEQLHFKRS